MNIYIYIYVNVCRYIYLSTDTYSSYPGLISVARVIELRTTDVTRLLKAHIVYIYVKIDRDKDIDRYKYRCIDIH